MLEKTLKFLSLVSILLVTLGYVSAYFYYDAFDIDIRNYIDLKFFISYVFDLSFVTIALLLIFAIASILIMLLRSILKSYRWKKIIVKHYIYFMFIATLGYFVILLSLFAISNTQIQHASVIKFLFLILVISTLINSLLFYSSFHVLLHIRRRILDPNSLKNGSERKIDIMRRHQRDIIRTDNVIRIAILSLNVLLVIFSVNIYESKRHYLIIESKNSINHGICFTYNGKTIQTGKNLIEIGHLPNWIFLYDRNDSTTKVFKMDEIDSLVIKNHFHFFD